MNLGEPATRTDRAVRVLERYILSEFEVGATLPSEADLARFLGVSRLTAREALRALEARGLVRVARGRRPTVTAPSSRVFGDFFGALLRQDPRAFYELTELRQALEMHSVAGAARRVGAGELELVRADLERMRAAVDPAEFQAADRDFHLHLAMCAGNQLVTSILRELAEPTLEVGLLTYRGHRERGGGSEDVVARHEAVVDRVAAHDVTGAVAAMARHFRETRRDMRAAFDRAGLEAPAGSGTPSF